MSKRTLVTIDSTDDSKKIKLINEFFTTNSNTNNNNINNNHDTTFNNENNINKLEKINLLNLATDELTHIISFCNIGQVVMFSLSCKLLYNIIREHLQITHPYTTTLMNDASFYSNKWSIAFALMTHRRLNINNTQSIKELNNIFDKMINLKEPFEKLTKTIILDLNSVDNDEEFITKFCELISKPTGQSKENVKMANISVKNVDLNDEEEIIKKFIEECTIDLPILTNMKSIPIGFFIKELIIPCEMLIYDFYRILLNCHSLEKLKISLYDDDDYTDEFYIQIPILENLKFLEFKTTSENISPTILVFDLLQLSPNLEYLDLTICSLFTYDAFLSFITKKCPNLRGFSYQSVEPLDELAFTDEGILNFLNGEPKLEYVNFESNCCFISGEICRKLGQFNNLKSININLKYSMNQCDDIYFGGGVLDKLEFIGFGNGFKVGESKGKKMIQSLIEIAPNIKEIGSLFERKALGNFNILDFSLSPLLTVFPNQYIFTSLLENHIDQLVEWLNKAKRLEEIKWEFNLVDFSKLEPIPSLKKITFTKDIEPIVGKELGRVFPSVTQLVVMCENEKNFVEMVKDGSFQDLKVYSNQSYLSDTIKQIVAIRPNVYGLSVDGVFNNVVQKCKIPDTRLQFEKEWLILDQVVQEKTIESKIFKFFNYPRYP